MKQKCILILGGNIVQSDATRMAKQLGYYVISSDLHEDNPGHKIADEYCKVDIVDKEAVLKEARRMEIDGIVPYGSDALAPIAAYVSEKMGLPGNPYESVNILTHKDLLREFLRDNNFATPWSDGFDDLDEALSFYNHKVEDEDYHGYAIMKPVDSAGSRGVFKISSPEDITKNWDVAMGYSSCGRVIIEEFIEKVGPQVDGDVFVHEGKIIFAGFVDQHHVQGLSELVPVSLSSPSVHSMETKEKAVCELQRLFSLLKISTGPCNVEFVVGKDGKIYFIDLGPRNGGCRIPFLEKEAMGFDEDLFTIKAAVGDELPQWNSLFGEQKDGNCVMYYRPFANRNGIYEGLWMSDYFKSKVIDIAPLMAPGEDVSLANNGNDTAAVVFGRFEDAAEMLSTIDNMSEHMKVMVS